MNLNRGESLNSTPSEYWRIIIVIELKLHGKKGRLKGWENGIQHKKGILTQNPSFLFWSLV